ncbi:MAG: Ltp family lipoprotein [Patescibacteria group bacterium]|nr:Ltp family lipoprotein [Patescibacteria group bacterium]
MAEQSTTNKKITIGLILSWIFGVLFALIGIVSVFSEPVPGIVMLIMAAVLLPPINKLVDEKWKFRLSSGMKIIVIIIGFIIFNSTVDASKQQNNQSKVQQEQSASSTKQQKDEVKPTEEQPQTVNNKKSIETEKTEIIPPSNEKKVEAIEEKPEPTKEVTVPSEYKSALNKAIIYSKTMNMSKQGVYDQLVSEYGEKFSANAAQYAIDNMKADWNSNALVKAKTYQDTMNMSPSAIHDQLTSTYGEKFTKAEADYAIQHLND